MAARTISDRARLDALRSRLPDRVPSTQSFVADAARALTPRLLRQPAVTHTTAVRAARALDRASGLLAFSVLTDSALEHYRGGFRNKAMYTPLVVSALTLVASGHGTTDARPSAHRFRDVVYGVAAVTGLVGTGFHALNIGKRIGGFRWLNFFYGAPIGAPMAILLSGALGVAAERVRDTPSGGRPHLWGLGAAEALALLNSVGIAGTTAEAWLLHFRGNFQNPFMYLPVTIPPASAALLADAALRGGQKRRDHARAALWSTVATGLAGVGFHIWGVKRMMGGWSNWKQNVLDGPPIPTPPAFTGLALAGLAALELLEEHGDD